MKIVLVSSIFEINLTDERAFITVNKDITAGDEKLDEVFGSERIYDVSYYQRDYKWSDHAETMFVDLYTSFKNDSNSFYFLGAYVVDEQKVEGKSYSVTRVIDGQQRLTTLTLLFIALSNSLRNDHLYEADEILNKVIRSSVEDRKFKLAIEKHSKVLDYIVDHNDKWLINDQDIYKDNHLYENYKKLQSKIADEKLDPLAFYNWLLTHVQMAKIIAPNANASYTIFETMNDRGLDLASHEILKGFILSNIEDEKERELAKRSWEDTSVNVDQQYRKYRSIFSKPKAHENFESMDKFLEVFLNAKYAVFGVSESDSDTQSSVSSTDTVKSGSVHRWVRRYSISHMKLQESRDYVKLVKSLAFFSEKYIELLKIAAGESNDSSIMTNTLSEMKGVANSFSGDEYRILLLSGIHESHDREEILEIWETVSHYLDITWAKSFWNGKGELNKDTVLKVSQILRNDLVIDSKNRRLYELAEILGSTSWNNEAIKIRSSKNIRNTTRFILRLSCYLDRIKEHNTDNIGEHHAKSFLSYLHKNGVELELEHILPKKPYAEQLFGEHERYNLFRENIGALTLITKTKNGSFSDKSPKEKIPHYEGFALTELIKENHYSDKKSQLFNSSIGYQNLNSFFEVNGITKPRAGDTIDAAFIQHRNKFYLDLAMKLWSEIAFKERYKGDWDDLERESKSWDSLNSSEPLIFSYTWKDCWKENNFKSGRVLIVENSNKEKSDFTVSDNKKIYVNREYYSLELLEDAYPIMNNIKIVETSDKGQSEIFDKDAILSRISSKQKLFAELREKSKDREDQLRTLIDNGNTIISLFDAKRENEFEKITNDYVVLKSISEDEIKDLLKELA